MKNPINKIHPTTIINEPVKLGNYIETREYSVIGIVPFAQLILGSRNSRLEIPDDGFKRKEQLFGVEIGDYVWIANHVSIAGGTVRPTKIGSRVIIGPYTYIAHDCKIGDRTEIVNAFINGYVEIGDSAYIGPGTTIRNRIKIGKNSFIGMGSNVVEDIPDDVMAYGNPCKVQRKLSGLSYLAYRATKKVERMMR